jgi:hypothetical protein
MHPPAVKAHKESNREPGKGQKPDRAGNPEASAEGNPVHLAVTLSFEDYRISLV